MFVCSFNIENKYIIHGSNVYILLHSYDCCSGWTSTYSPISHFKVSHINTRLFQWTSPCQNHSSVCDIQSLCSSPIQHLPFILYPVFATDRPESHPFENLFSQLDPLSTVIDNWMVFRTASFDVNNKNINYDIMFGLRLKNGRKKAEEICVRSCRWENGSGIGVGVGRNGLVENGLVWQLRIKMGPDKIYYNANFSYHSGGKRFNFGVQSSSW